ncbi:MAG: lipase family protein [Bdellovibrionota bacterium]
MKIVYYALILSILNNCKSITQDTEKVGSSIKASEKEEDANQTWLYEKINGELQRKKFDFCPSSSVHNNQNAYWLGALANTAYVHKSIIEEDFKSVRDLPSFSKIEFFSSQPPSIGDKREVSNLTLALSPPMPPNACLNWASFKNCFSKPDGNFFYSLPDNPLKYLELSKKKSNAPECGISDLPSLDGGKALPFALVYSHKDLEEVQKYWRDCIKKPNSSCNNNSTAAKRYQVIDKAVIDYIKRVKEKEKKNENQKEEKNKDQILYDRITGFDSPTFLTACDYYQQRTNPFKDTQISWFENKDMVVISFRGTEAGSLIDISTDINFGSQTFNLGTGKDKDSVEIYNGFAIAHQLTMPWIYKNLQEVQPTNKPIFITGHSLGGALATLTTFQLLWEKRHGYLKNDFNMKALYTFGSPRVGKKNFAKKFKELTASYNVGAYRYVNFSDPVPRIPCGPLDPFFHVGQLYHARYGNNGRTENAVPELVQTENMLGAEGDIFKNNACLYAPLAKQAITDLVTSQKNLEIASKDHFMSNYYKVLDRYRSVDIECK